MPYPLEVAYMMEINHTTLVLAHLVTKLASSRRLWRREVDGAVFVGPDGGLLRRSNFARRAQRPAADGNHHIVNPSLRLHPVKPGLTFHGTRHSHKTWMIDDGIPEIAQALRLGHVMPDKVQETYSHVAAAVEARLLQRLQDRWDKAVIDVPIDLDSTWRSAA
ncbi:hypothetical protein ADL03_25435 [Nocardia sp. NRRL S-836]|nr:hypothetical protein ADL03_25435 [Nocardia sp. NRRL S-836]